MQICTDSRRVKWTQSNSINARMLKSPKKRVIADIQHIKKMAA